MNTDRSVEKLKLRPHHIFCDQFITIDFSDRGEEYTRIAEMIKKVIRSGTDRTIEIIEGVDDLCMACPLCQNDRCQSPQGNEDAVRKYDGRILKELGLSYGEKRSAQGLRMLIEQKAPLEFCRSRCPWKASCRVFELDCD